MIICDKCLSKSGKREKLNDLKDSSLPMLLSRPAQVVITDHKSQAFFFITWLILRLMHLIMIMNCP